MSYIYKQLIHRGTMAKMVYHYMLLDCKCKTLIQINKVHTSPTAMVMTCGVKPIPAEPDSHSPNNTINHFKQHKIAII